MFPDRFVPTPPGPSPTANEILETGSSVGIDLYRGANYFTLDGQWCCGLVSNPNTRRCVTFTACPTLDPLANGVIEYNRDTNMATYTCNTGHLITGTSSNTMNRTCSQVTATSAGTWSGSQPSCVAIAICSDLSLANGMIVYSPDVSPRTQGTVATHSCVTGFVLSGDAMRTCESNGQWSGSAPTCIAGCPDIPPGEMIVDGSVEYFVGTASSGGTTNARPVGVRATFTCDTGFFFVWASGNVNRDCQSGGTWSGSTPACELVCPDLSVPANAAIAYSGVSANSADIPTTPDGGVANARPVGIVATYSCPDSQFTLVGSATRTCQSDKSWSGSEPSCEIVCPDLPSNEIPTDGSVTYSAGAASTSGTTNARPVGVVATFTCDTGFFFVQNSGNVNRNCQSDGTWSGWTPSCEIVCSDLTMPSNGLISYSGGGSGGRPVGVMATYTCFSLFTLVGPQIRTCQSDRIWTPNTESTCQRFCTDLPALTNGDPISYDMGTSGSRPPGTVATHSCVAGYRIAGSMTRMCMDGAFTGSAPTCELICPDLVVPTNGMPIVYSDSNTPRVTGSTADYSCDTGYELVGDAQRMCTESGWSDTQPSCLAICADLTLSNGMISYSPDTTPRLEGTTATHSCDTGFRLMINTVVVNSQAATRTCQNDRTWSGITITCDRVPCEPPPSISNGSPGTPTSTVYQGTVDYSCSDGYQLTGSSTVTCQADGQWSTRPTCIFADCGPLPTPANGTVTLSSGTFLGSVASYSCDNGYGLIGSPTRTCGGDRSWSSQQPTCAAVSIGTPSGPAVAGSAFSLSCAVEADSLQPTITYQWLRGETVLTTGPLLEFQPHLFLSDSGEYTCRASISSPQLDQDHIILQTYQLTFESLNVQFRFSEVNCREYSQVDTIQKRSDIEIGISAGVESLCSCSFNTSLFSNPSLRCFPDSPEILTFRAQIRTTSSLPVSEVLEFMDRWIRQEGNVVVQGLALPFEFSCPTVIPQLNSEECPVDISTQPIVTEAPSVVGPVIGGVVVGLVCIIIIIIIVIVVVVVKKQRSQSKDIKQSSQIGKEPPVVLSELPEYETIDKYQDGVTYEQVESSEPTKDYNLTANTAYAPTTIN